MVLLVILARIELPVAEVQSERAAVLLVVLALIGLPVAEGWAERAASMIE